MNFPFIHIFWCGMAASVITCIIVSNLSDILNISADNDSPDWESK